jgi:hypothetical protein
VPVGTLAAASDQEGQDTDGSTTATTSSTQSTGHRVDQAGSTQLAYDDDGNRVGDATRVVTFDALGRAREVRDAATGALLALLDYDPLGRVGREVDGAIERWRYHPGSRCLHEADASGMPAAVRTQVPGMLLLIGEGRIEGAFTWHVDGHENLVLAVGTDGQPVERYRLGAFGMPTIHDALTVVAMASSGIGQRPIWGGIPWLGAAGLRRTPARLYDPVVGM